MKMSLGKVERSCENYRQLHYIKCNGNKPNFGITSLKIMPYLTFLFLFFANLLQTKLFCHFSLISFSLLRKQIGSQHSRNTGLLLKNKEKKKEKRRHFRHSHRDTVVKEVLSGMRMEMEASAKHSSPIMVGSYSNTWVALGSVECQILRSLSLVFPSGLFCYAHLLFTNITICSQQSLSSIHDF